MFSQAMIVAKEGITKGMTNIVGSDIADAILKTTGGTNLKGINKYQLYKLTIVGAYRPETSDISDQLQGIPGTMFNSQQKVVTNVEQLRTKATRIPSPLSS